MCGGEQADNEWTYRTRKAAEDAKYYILRHSPNALVRVVPLVSLTDAERGAVGRAAGLIGDTVANDSEQSMGDFLALRGLWERTK